MKNILKILVFNVNILILIIGINYYGDAIHLFQYSIEENIALNLLDNNVVVLPDIYDERIERINFIREQKIIPNMAVIGSSSVRLITKYNPCELINYGMSGADFWDYIGIVGALDYYEKMPKEILIGIDPNAFVAGKRSNSIKNYIEYEKKIINTNGVQRESVQVNIGSTDWEKISKRFITTRVR